MKNIIPLIIAVVLAAAAVFAVSRLIKPKEDETAKQFVSVVGAGDDVLILPNSEIQESWLQERKVEVSSIPAKAIPWNQRFRVIGQTSLRTIAKGDYVLLTDIAGISPDFDQLVANGEWAVPVTFADAALLPFLEPGMEISILGTFTQKEKVEKVDSTEKADIIEQDATCVLFPRVKILDIGKGDGIRRESSSSSRGGGTIIIALSPEKAATLVAAQRTMDLYPALRNRKDGGYLKRGDVGIVNETTFQNLTKGLASVNIPDGTISNSVTRTTSNKNNN